MTSGSKIPQPLRGAPPLAEIANGASIEELSFSHDKIISLILAEEENLISAHREHIDTVVEIVK
jgi:hypothetical protein